jgi:nitroreductase
MELMEAIEKRRTVRDFQDRPVPEDVIKKALYAGLKAPSYNHQKEVYFTLVRDPQLLLALTVADNMNEEVSESFRKVLQTDYEELARDMYMDAIPKQRRMTLKAPEYLIVAYKPIMPVSATRTVNNLNGHSAVWACIENILLSLAEDGVYGTTMVPENAGHKGPAQYPAGARGSRHDTVWLQGRGREDNTAKRGHGGRRAAHRQVGIDG